MLTMIKKIQSIGLIETLTCGTSKDLLYKKEKIKHNNTIKNTKMINFDEVLRENIKDHNPLNGSLAYRYILPISG